MYRINRRGAKKKEKEMVSLIRLVSALTLCWGIPSELDCHSFWRRAAPFLSIKRKKSFFFAALSYYICIYNKNGEKRGTWGVAHSAESRPCPCPCPCPS